MDNKGFVRIGYPEEWPGAPVSQLSMAGDKNV